MKKLLVALLGFAFGSLSITQAQNFDLGFVDLNFCDGQNQLHIEASGAIQTGFCFTLTNLSNTAGNVKVMLVDGEMSVGEHSVKACKTTSEGYFTKFVTLTGGAINSGENISGSISTKNNFGVIALPPLGSVTQYGFIDVPSGFVGMLNGCVTLTVSEGDANDAGMFQIVNRKANTIDITITGDYVSSLGLMDMKNYSGDKWKLSAGKIVSSSANILVTHKKDGDSLVIGLENTGFVDEQFQISATIKTAFGKFFNKNFIVASGALYGQDSLVIEYPLGDLPFFKGKYLVEVEIKHSPVATQGLDLFGGDASVINQSLSFFLFPARRVMGIYALIILLLLSLFLTIASIKKKKLLFPKK